MIKRIVDKINRICIAIYHYETKKNMAYCGKNVIFENNVRINKPHYLSIMNNVHICRDFHIHFSKNNHNTPFCRIGNNCYIGPNCHIVCINEIQISDNVIIASNCFIGDGDHDYTDTSKSIVESGYISKGGVNIGEGSWIGANVCILSNVKIGQHCVIGAGSIITKSIPDFSVVVGNPGRPIKNRKQWDNILNLREEK